MLQTDFHLRFLKYEISKFIPRICTAPSGNPYKHREGQYQSSIGLGKAKTYRFSNSDLKKQEK
jgi:hypothetical protein